MGNEDEQAYKEEMAKAGVDLPEEDVEAEDSQEEEAEAPKTAQPDKPAEKEASEEEEHLQDESQEDKPQRKRSIYDDLKAKKAEAKSEKEKREQVERERDELQSKLDALGRAETPEERQEAQDDIEKFAKEINADPDALRKMRELFLKDVTPSGISKEDIEELKAWKTQNSKIMEKALFDNEYQETTPKLKEIFPKASDDELSGAIKAEIDRLSHTEKFHDKSLDYVAFVHREQLSKLISPRKRGAESKGRGAEEEVVSTDFDPNADLTKMSPKARAEWEKAWKELTKGTNELMSNDNGKKSF